MVFFALGGVLRGAAAAAYKSTPHLNPLCGLAQYKKSSFLKRILPRQIPDAFNPDGTRKGLLALGGVRRGAAAAA